MKTKTMAVSTVLVACWGLTGCLSEKTYLDPNENVVADFGGDEGYYEGGGNLAVKNANIRGDIGPVRSFDGAADAYGSADSGYTQLTLNGNTRGGTGLVMLYLDTDLSTLPAGETRLRGSNEMVDSNYVQLCSDTSDGSQHFDGIAEDVTIVVEPQGDGTRDVTVDATITEGFDGSSYNGAEPTLVTSKFNLAGIN